MAAVSDRRVALTLALLPAVALAQSLESVPAPSALDRVGRHPLPEGEDEVAPPSLVIERFSARVSVMSQEGRGLQSRAEPDANLRGREYATIVNPFFAARLRQEGGITHDVYLPVDVVTAASTDALDAISTASRDNEAISLDIYTTVADGADQRLILHWGGHFEEEMRALRAGVGGSFDLADDNAQLTVMFDAVVDVLDPVQWNGWDPGLESRQTWSGNLAVSQLLGPGTQVSLAYGVTGQSGHIHTPWNSVPTSDGNRVGDLWPTIRVRHAATGRLQHAFEETRTFLAVEARGYTDSADTLAFTAQLTGTQYVLDDLWLRAHVRYHTQTAPSFWMREFDRTSSLWTPRTAESDLEALDALEVGGAVRFLLDRRAAPTIDTTWVELGYVYYGRTNGLDLHLGTLGWGTTLAP